MKRLLVFLLALAIAGATPVTQTWSIVATNTVLMNEGVINTLIAALTAVDGRIATMAGCDGHIDRAITSESLGQNPIDEWWFADLLVRGDGAEVLGAHGDDPDNRVYIKRSL
jgi:hypothetical protein